jgi:tRNA A-37 threonylcarbamoyl transferase component Bud32
MSLLDRIRKALEPDYTVVRELGAGGMGAVFEAVNRRLEHRVAVKVLKPELATEPASQRFIREAQLLARLKHPGIVKVHDAGAKEGLSWFVMDLVEGETLAARLQRGPLPVEETIQLGRELLSALAAAHEKGIVHRDVKPANIFVERGHALLADFGIARTSTSSESDPALTATDQAIGTFWYMAPEQRGGGIVGPASDQYSLALVLYECLNGKPWEPLKAPAAGDWSKVPADLARTLKRALALDASERWPDTSSFATALAPRNRTRMVIAATVVALGLLAAAIWWRSGQAGATGACTAATAPFSPGIAASVSCEGYGAWLEAERVFGVGNWQAADTAYRSLLAANPGCAACDFRLLEVDRWLERKIDTARRTRVRERAGEFQQEWRELVTAVLAPANLRVQQLDDLRNNYRDWQFVWYAFGSELFNRGSFVGRRRSDAIEALDKQVALDRDFVPAWTDRTLAFIAIGDSARADSALGRLRSLDRATGLAQAQRLLAGIAFAFRFTPYGLKAWNEARQDSSIGAGRPEVAAGPRVLPGLGTPLGAVELGRAFEGTGELSLRRSGLIAEMLGSIALGRPDSVVAAGRRLNRLFASNEFLAFAVMLPAAAVLLDEETTASEAAEVEVRLRTFTRPMMPPGVRRDAAWLIALAAVKRRDAAAGREMLRLVSDEPPPAFRRTLIEASLLAAYGSPDSALVVTDQLATDLEAWDRAERSPLLRAAARLSRAQWFAATGVPENARSEYRWHEHFHLPDYPMDYPVAADGDWAFSTLAYWRQARLLDRAPSMDTADLDVCTAYRIVAERWSLGDARHRARADTARTRLGSLRCEPST